MPSCAADAALSLPTSSRAKASTRYATPFSSPSTRNRFWSADWVREAASAPVSTRVTRTRKSSGSPPPPATRTLSAESSATTLSRLGAAGASVS